ncbi:hypothetical protein [Nannocystis sp.]|uniref:hypothetical protein n=1 Tax=Nannocystis sp. TaxID=1962667 RepID=UPI0025F1A5C6|nr:hypothetical protein [Nannocystis sp.]MBK7825141.1 hypothetical protein [Nannocystis sp.]
MSKHIATSVIALTLTIGCDADPEARAHDIAALADDDLDPEIRAQIEAELADDDARPEAVGDLSDDAATPGGCFFCPPPPANDPSTYTPVVLGPYVQVNAQSNPILYMQAASSFIVLPGATVRLQVPNSVQSYGPYALSYDVSGTQIRANVSGGFPNNSCRIITVTNPNNHVSSPVQLCR